MNEKPIPLDESLIARIVGVKSSKEKGYPHEVLKTFFAKTRRGWTHKRCERELYAYRLQVKRNKMNGIKGGRPKTQSVSSGLATRNPLETQNNPNQNQNQNQMLEPEPENHRAPVVGPKHINQRGNKRDAEGVNGSAKNAEAFSRPVPEMVNRLGLNELKGLRTTLLRTVHDERMPNDFRNVCSARLTEVENRLRKKGIAV